jgi:hypothetical protein
MAALDGPCRAAARTAVLATLTVTGVGGWSGPHFPAMGVVASGWRLVGARQRPNAARMRSQNDRGAGTGAIVKA